MKKNNYFLLALIFLLVFSSCNNNNDDMDDAWFVVEDTLKISAFLFDEDAGEDYFIINEQGEYEYNINDTVYIKNEGDFFNSLMNYEPERLKLEEARLLYPIAGFGASGDMININLFFEFNGVLEIISEQNDVQLSFNSSAPFLPFQAGIAGGGAREYGFKLMVPSNINGVFISVNPLGSNTGAIVIGGEVGGQADRFLHYIGRTYYLTINRYVNEEETTGMPIVSAQLKLTQLEDEYWGSDASGKFKIELISYETKYGSK